MMPGDQTTNCKGSFIFFRRCIRSTDYRNLSHPAPSLFHPAHPVDHHQPELCHLLDRISWAFTPDPRSLHPTIRHLVDTEGRNIVHHDTTDFHVFECPHNTVDVLGKDPDLETETASVCQGKRFGKRIIGHDGYDRSKYLLSDYPHIRRCIDDNRWRKQGIFKSATDQDPCTLVHCFLDFQVRFLRFCPIYHWSYVCCWFPGIANFQSLYCRKNFIQSLFIHRAVNQYTLDRYADLPLSLIHISEPTRRTPISYA